SLGLASQAGEAEVMVGCNWGWEVKQQS
ncbi:MAG: hypothetical protein RLZZ396_1102, partial [Planctomycetota bacterium]